MRRKAPATFLFARSDVIYEKQLKVDIATRSSRPNEKPTELPKSVFRRRRKCRGVGFYTGCLNSPEKVIYKNATTEHLEKETQVFVENPLKIWKCGKSERDSYNFEKYRRCADNVWELCSSIPSQQIHQLAVVTNTGQKLTWMDLNSINNASGVHSVNYPSGWMTSEAVHAYVRTSTSEANAIDGRDLFTCCDPYLALEIINGKRFRRPPQISNVGRPTAVSDNPSHVYLFPILWNRRFILLSFDLSAKTLTAFNSIDTFDQSLLTAIHSNFIPFIGRCFNCTNVQFFQNMVVAQKDSSSCGVCVCISADTLCFAEHPPPIGCEAIDQYRAWITFKLILASSKVDKRVADKILAPFLECNTTIGLHNVGNSCWFNSALQALSATNLYRNKIFEKSLEKTSSANYVQRLLSMLYHRKPVTPEELPVVRDMICQERCWKTGDQQDAAEFILSLLNSEFGDSINDEHSTKGTVLINHRCLTCDTSYNINFSFSSIFVPIYSDEANTEKLDLLEKIKQFPDACTTVTWCCDVKNFVTAKYETYPPTMVINTARGGGQYKICNAISLTRRMRVDDVDYWLMSAVSHIAHDIKCGHYVTYVILPDNYVLLYDDINITVNTWDNLEENIAKNRVVLFYRKVLG